MGQGELAERRARAESLGDEIATLVATLDATTHKLLCAIRAFDEERGWALQGAKSCAHWLTWRTGRGLHAAREWVRVANALGELPQIDASLAAGSISYTKVRAMTRVATPDNEPLLLAQAKTATGAQLERVCAAFGSVKQRLDGKPPLEEQRYVRRQTLRDGSVLVIARLSPDEAAVVMDALRAVRAELSAPSSESSAPSAESSASLAESSASLAESSAVPAESSAVPAESSAASAESSAASAESSAASAESSAASAESSAEPVGAARDFGRLSGENVPAGTSPTSSPSGFAPESSAWVVGAERDSARLSGENVPAGTSPTHPPKVDAPEANRGATLRAATPSARSPEARSAEMERSGRGLLPKPNLADALMVMAEATRRIVSLPTAAVVSANGAADPANAVDHATFLQLTNPETERGTSPPPLGVSPPPPGVSPPPPGASPPPPATSRARAASPRTTRPELLLHLRSSDIVAGAWQAELHDGTPLSGDALCRLACDSGVVVVQTDEAGDPLDVGRRRRTIPPALMRALLVRDRGCRFPGCNQQACLEGHHIEHWAQGGATSKDNTVLLCHHHHVAVHEGGFSIEHTDAGPRFRDPAGRIIPAVPPAATPAAPTYIGDPRCNLIDWDGSRANIRDAVNALVARHLAAAS